MTSRPLPDPGGCTHCGIGEREHGQRWTGAAGWHFYAAPPQEQIKARMRARRVAADAPRARPDQRTAPNPAPCRDLHAPNMHRPSQADSREDTP